MVLPIPPNPRMAIRAGLASLIMDNMCDISLSLPSIFPGAGKWCGGGTIGLEFFAYFSFNRDYQ